jgi:hypothetical protein
MNDPNAALRERIAVLEREKYDLTLRVIDARERVAKQRIATLQELNAELIEENC